MANELINVQRLLLNLEGHRHVSSNQITSV